MDNIEVFFYVELKRAIILAVELYFKNNYT